MRNVILREELPDLVWQVEPLVTDSRAIRDSAEKDFVEYHRDNPQVYADFAKYTQMAINAGKTQGSAWHIVNRMRWDYYIIASDANSAFILSNDYIAFYARLFMERNREYLDWFETKLRISERKIVEDLGAVVESRTAKRRETPLAT